MIYVGIDPGKTGAIASIFPDGSCNVMDLTMDMYDLRDILDAYIILIPDEPLIFIERAQMRPNQNCTQTLINYGKLVGSIELCQRDYVEVTPQRWKRDLGLYGKDKNASLELARKLFPSCKEQLQRKLDHNRGEALLIAYWGKEFYDKTNKV